MQQSKLIQICIIEFLWEIVTCKWYWLYKIAVLLIIDVFEVYSRLPVLLCPHLYVTACRLWCPALICSLNWLNYCLSTVELGVVNPDGLSSEHLAEHSRTKQVKFSADCHLLLDIGCYTSCFCFYLIAQDWRFVPFAVLRREWQGRITREL